MKKPVVAVVFGSRSTEHDVSIITALVAVIAPLQASKKYQVVPIYISKQGKWYCDSELLDVSLYSSGRIDDWLRQHEPVTLAFGDGLQLVTGGWQRRRLKIDVVFPALHGTHGEDGAAMGVFDMAGVAYVGCEVAASAIAMDKVLTKQVVQSAGVAVAPFVHFSKAEYTADPDDWITKINRKLRYPLFVKPAHLGSSIGITRVADPQDLRNAIEVALHYDDKALVEEGIRNLVEVTLPIIGNDRPRPALLEQPALKSEDFFDFQTKYMQGGKKGGDSEATRQQPAIKGAQGYSTIPADLPKPLYAAAEATGLAVYRALGCSGTARVDMLIDTEAKVVYCNEVNPLPGSLYLHNWNQAGISNVEVVTTLIDLALERQAQRQQQETVFSTNFLKQF